MESTNDDTLSRGLLFRVESEQPAHQLRVIDQRANFDLKFARINLT
jgi:hypothetical protein